VFQHVRAIFALSDTCTHAQTSVIWGIYVITSSMNVAYRSVVALHGSSRPSPHSFFHVCTSNGSIDL
jgi:hypothetical protein